MPRLVPATAGRHIAVLAAGVCVYFVQGPGYVRHPWTRLADAGDSVLNEWILAWDAHALTSGGLRVWDAPIYYPVRGALAFSEAMFGNLWLTAPVQWLSGNPVLACNALVLASFVLSAYATFLLVKRLSGDLTAGVVAGFLFSFNPYRWSEVCHTQLLPFFWAPLALLQCHSFLERRRGPVLAGLVALVVAQLYASMYLGMILCVTLGVFAGAGLFVGPRRAQGESWRGDRRFLAWVAGAALTGALALAPLAANYARVTRTWNFSRTESDNVSFSCEPLGLLVPNQAFRAYRLLPADLRGLVQGPCGLGVMPWALAGLGLLCVRRRGADLPAERVRVGKQLAWTALACAVLMLGPYLIVLRRKLDIPLPYLLIYHLLPGAKGMRVPTRFIFPLLLCLAALGGFAIAEARANWRRWPRGLRLASAAAFAVALGADYAVTESAGVSLPTRDTLPPVYAHLARTNPGRPVLELPAGLRQQFQYLHAQTVHWRPLVGGETGSYPPAILDLARRTAGPPTATTGLFLALTPAQTVVIHLDRLGPALAAAWACADLSSYGFRNAGRFGDAIVWERVSAAVAASPRLRLARAERHAVARRFWDRVELRALVTAADAGHGWRHLERGLDEVRITWTGRDGRDHNERAQVELPAYLLPGECVPVTLGVLPAEARHARRLHVSGRLLESYDVDFDDSSLSRAGRRDAR